ncbi:MAG: hypothetical protein AAGA56_07100 [Myxococcota bacterium]
MSTALHPLSLAGFAIVTSLLAACASETVSDGDGDTTTSDPDDPPICTGFENETSESQTFVLRNDTEETIFVRGLNCPGDAFQLEQNGSPVELPARDVCDLTCENLQSNPGICPAIACQETIHVLLPGGELRQVWSGLVSEQTEMPSACYFEEPEVTACARHVPAAREDYEVVFDVAVGDDACEGDCVCIDDGLSCSLQGGSAIISEQTTTARETFTYGDAGETTVRFTLDREG